MGINVAIVGLGRVGGKFLEEMMKHSARGIAIRCVCEYGETPARQIAAEAGLTVMPWQEMVALGDAIDVIFDLTGSATVRFQMREELAKHANTHSVVVPETVSRLVWALMSEEALPEVHGNVGYLAY